MKVAILAGGVGARLAEETEVKPKPMVEIGGRPILWHIMNHYLHFNFNHFVIALGYKGDYIKRYMLDYYHANQNLTVNLRSGSIETVNEEPMLDVTVQLVETGEATMTGGRVKRIAPYLGNETFMMTYGDGLCDVDINALLEFHAKHGRLATVTAVHPPARFGKLDIDGDQVLSFAEKPQITGDLGPIVGEGWINGGFFVCEPGVLDYIEGDKTSWEREPLEGLAKDGQLMAFRHYSFWQCMDTIRDKRMLDTLWESGNPPWKLW